MANSTGRSNNELLDFALSREFSMHQYQMLIYLDRWDHCADGMRDLQKMRDFLDKYIADKT